jgi:hypothetical protein
LADFCGVRPPKKETHLELVEKHKKSLDAWKERAGILLEFEVSAKTPEMIVKTHMGQKTILLVAYNQALILLYRPFILIISDTTSVEKTDEMNKFYPAIRVKSYLKILVGACDTILSTMDEVCSNSPYYRNLWVSLFPRQPGLLPLYALLSLLVSGHKLI